MAAKKSKRSEPVNLLVPGEGTQDLARFIAILVRDELEDFHVKYLSDAQMAELNPLVRNAICTALHVIVAGNEFAEARMYEGYTRMTIPDYWEAPRLTEDYMQFMQKRRERTNGEGGSDIQGG